jgi:hypothetical protein
MSSLSQTAGANHPEYMRCNQLLSNMQATNRASRYSSSQHQVGPARKPASIYPRRPIWYACNGASSVLGILYGSHLDLRKVRCPLHSLKEGKLIYWRI